MYVQINICSNRSNVTDSRFFTPSVQLICNFIVFGEVHNILAFQKLIRKRKIIMYTMDSYGLQQETTDEGNL